MPLRRDQPEPAPRTTQRDEHRFRLGGLYEGKNNSLTGNVHVASIRRDGNTLGDRLIERIQYCMDENLPLRFLVFENNGKYPEDKAPFSLHLTVGRPRAEVDGSGSSGSWTNPSLDPKPDPESEQPPRPARRVPPRRG